MFGLAAVPETSLLLAGLLYTPYNLLAAAMAGLVVWFGPQSWDWSRKMNSAKVLLVIIVLFVTVAVLSVQSYNPFIYFNF